MTPQEILRIKQQSPALQRALKAYQVTLWPFLRAQVVARYGYYIQGHHECECCQTVVYPTLKSPYNAFHPGWCIECVLHAFLTPGTPLYKTPQEIEEEQKSRAECYAWEPPNWPNDYDGPPILWG
jgi:hypothetical protein